MKIEFSVAEQADDAAIRSLLTRNPMPGAVTIAFEREPDYFRGHGVMGGQCVTVKAVDAESRELAGVICIASAVRFVGGSARPVGYIGQLRIDKRYRGYLIPLRAITFVRDLVSSGWPDLWFNALADENPEPVEIFATRPRPSFPRLELVTRILTLGILTHAQPRRPQRAPRDIAVRRGDDVGFAPIVQFLREQGPHREFFPRYTEEDFVGNNRTPGFSAADFLVAVDDNAIAGVCGVWDQSSFKQTVVHGYRGWLGRVRPFLNAIAPVIGMKRLPGIGERIESAYLSFLAVRNDDPHIFRALLIAAIHSAHAMGKEYLLAGFSERDPLLDIARRFRHLRYRSRMYAYSFDGTVGPAAFDRTRIPYVEIAAL
ncbi:MAG: hypothetical protein KAU31_17270 [Spirochaetaceae bacterium]|nr:hypothetical protein [Spirochaetaceae bacterium]